ncbi:MAG: low-complexity protein [Candidatus Syntrophoarchaeum butanivorans]|uniref:Low-complexity protein n=1 Tax=Candidatus Syntropharchaeum butanivorans TaxID=1839936 RepID=A0A1F2P3F8_9EURY|nr:MAG: low-complexity protein [Candidatus Syntrophoarchaeum butanivorans]
MGSWECPLEALAGEEYCYWHREEEGKEPDDAKLRELKENTILGAFLRGAKLSGKELQEAFLRFANLEEANLSDAKLQEANLSFANLEGADLYKVELQGADLLGANLQGADLSGANLQGADLYKAELQGADLSFAELQEADLTSVNLEGANLSGVRVDSETCLDGANLTYANLYLSYLDETKTLRNAKFEKEINEIIADFLKVENKELAVFDVQKIRWSDPEVVAKLLEERVVRYVSVGVGMVFFDRKRRRVVKNPENAESRIFQRPRKRRNSEKEENYVEISELNDLIEREGLEEYLYRGGVEELYEASYEVYNNLYYFYIQNGRIEEALDMHYRRCEVRRKLLREKGWINCLRSWVYDFFILKLLTGYGVKILRM